MTSENTTPARKEDFRTRGTAGLGAPSRGDMIYGKKNRSTKTTTLLNPYTQKTESFSTKYIELDPAELKAKAKKAPGNPRNLEGVDIKKRDTYQLLKNEGVMTHSALAYQIEGDDTIYVINGWTRCCSILDMYKDAIAAGEESSFNFKFPVDILKVTAEDARWVVTALVFSETSSTEHSVFEKCALFTDFYKQYVEAHPECRLRHTWESVRSISTGSPSFGQYVYMLVALALRDILTDSDPALVKKFKSLNDYKLAISWIVERVSDNLDKQGASTLLITGGACAIDVKSALLDKLKGETMELFIKKLSESTNAKEAFSPTKSTEANTPRPPLLINDDECSLNLSMTRSDLSPESMAMIKEVFESNKDVLEQMVAKIEAIYKAETEGQNKTKR